MSPLNPAAPPPTTNQRLRTTASRTANDPALRLLATVAVLLALATGLSLGVREGAVVASLYLTGGLTIHLARGVR